MISGKKLKDRHRRGLIYFEVLSQHLPGYTEEYYKCLVRTDGVRAERIIKNSNGDAGRIFGVWPAETE
jgi:hypothetical protein